MSGPNVVDKAKMVFHYTAKIAPTRPNNEIQDINPCKEMKVCFRHSKHSIKCDVNAPCVECDGGMKLYSYDQSRRHLDVVRAEKRFESIEVDRSENIIEKLCDIDENGKRIVHLLELILTKQSQIANSLTELASCVKESYSRNDMVVSTGKVKHEYNEDEEQLLPTLKEISRNTLRSHKKQEEICAHINECHNVLVDLKSNGHNLNNANILGHAHLSDVNSNLTKISAKIEESASNFKEASVTQCTAVQQLQSTNESFAEELRQIKTVITDLKSSVKDELVLLRNDIVSELQLGRNDLINNQNSLREDMKVSLRSVKDEVQSFKNMSQAFTDDMKDNLPEKLMDVFSSILLLSTENGRKLDNKDMDNETTTNSPLINTKSDY